MALRPTTTTKIRAKESEPIEEAPRVVDQRRKPDARYWLQVDRQTKRSFATLEPAAEAGMLIKKAHPIVQVSIYDFDRLRQPDRRRRRAGAGAGRLGLSGGRTAAAVRTD